MKYIPYLPLKHIKRFFGNLFSPNAMKIFLILAGLLAWFYWFQYRPTQIRKDCWQKVIQGLSEKTIEGARGVNKAFSICLVSKGLKSESVF